MSEDWASHAADEFRCRPGLSFGGPYHTRDGGTVEPVGKGYEVAYPPGQLPHEYKLRPFDDGYELGEYYNDVNG